MSKKTPQYWVAVMVFVFVATMPSCFSPLKPGTNPADDADDADTVIADSDWIKPEPIALREVFVSPSGSGSGSTMSDPASLEKAIQESGSGDKIWLLEGEYRGSFKLTQNGTAEHPIVYRSYNKKRVVISGGFLVTGSHTWIWGLEITDPDGIHDPDCAIIHGAGEGLTVINTIIHPERKSEKSTAVALGAWDYPGQLYYGNIVYNGHHNIYTQNDAQKGLKWFVNNLSINAINLKINTAYEFHAYAEGGQLSGFRLVGNIFANTTIDGTSVKGAVLLGGKNQTANKNIVLDSNYFYNSDLTMGYFRPIQSRVINNYVVDAQFIYEKFWGAGEEKFTDPPPIHVTGNTFIWYRTENAHVRLHTSAYKNIDGEFNRVDRVTPLRTKDIWNFNTYSPDFMGELVAGGVDLNRDIRSLADWRYYTGKAGNSFDTGSGVRALPSAPEVVVIPNKYEKGRAFIVVYNFGNAAKVRLDLSGVAPDRAATFKVYKHNDVYGTVVGSGVYSEPLVLTLPGDPSGSIFSAYLLLGD